MQKIRLLANPLAWSTSQRSHESGVSIATPILE